MSVRGRKLAADLLANRARTALVIVALAVGLAGVSTTLRARAVFTENLGDGLAASAPAAARIITEGARTADVDAVAGLPGVAMAEGRSTTFARIEVGSGLRPLRLVGLSAPGAETIDVLRRVEGTWPPGEGAIALERSSLGASGLDVGDVATVIDAAGNRHDLRIAATVHDLGVVSGHLVDQVIFGYGDVTTTAPLGAGPPFDEILLAVDDGIAGDVTSISQVASAAAEVLSGRGLQVEATLVPTPGTHILDGVISSLLLVLGSLGVLSLLLSGFLVFNTVSATLSRHRSQIGVMKAIGGSRADILTLYLAMIGVYSAAALAISIPAGSLGARFLTTRLGELLNIDIDRFGVPLWVWVVELVIGLLVPIGAALGPILSGTRVTVAEAIRGDTGDGFGAGRIDRALARVRGLSASWRYASRNTFRKKLRLSLTVVALAMGGAILVTVLTLRSSLLATVDQIAAYWQQDVTIDLDRPTPAGAVDAALEPDDRNLAMEGWLVVPATVVRPNGTDAADETFLFSVPADSRFIEPTLLRGRWLRPDQPEAVVNVDVAANEPGLELGDEIRFRVAGSDATFHIVGISTSQLIAPGEPRPSAPIAYVPEGTLDGLLPILGLVNRLAISAPQDGPDASTLADRFDADLRDAGIGVLAVETRARLLTQTERLTTPILLLLSAMAGLFALVGGLGLLGTMTLNVLERTKELGLIRSVGATGPTVRTIVLVEGMTVAGLSWLLGSVMAVPLGWVMGRAVGASFIKAPLVFRFDPLGVALWFVLVVLVAGVSCWAPARRASSLSVREAIAYE